MGVCQEGDSHRGGRPRIEYGAGSSASSGQAPSAEGGVMGECLTRELGDWQDWGAGDGFPFARERRWWIREPGMGSRLHGNDGGGLGSRGWVPVVTGTTVVGGWFPYAAPGRAGFKPAPTGAVAVKYAPTRGKRGRLFHGNHPCRLRPAHQGDENGVVCWHGRGRPPPQVPRGSGRHSAVAGCYFIARPHEGMIMASSVGMVEADPAPGPSGLGTT